MRSPEIRQMFFQLIGLVLKRQQNQFKLALGLAFLKETHNFLHYMPNIK